MDNVKMGQFITEMRKSHNMTQKDLAIKLNVSDKAVSKWERGLSCPDIALLTPLADILGVTVTDLLSSEKSNETVINVEASVVSALEYGEKSAKHKFILTHNIILACFSIFLLFGIAAVSIVDVAITGMFTWSVIPIFASVFSWLVMYPVFKYGVKGIIGSLIALSLFITPFLFALDYAISRISEYEVMLFSLGIRIVPLSVAFIWASFFLVRIFKKRILLMIAFIVLLTSPVSLFTNILIANMWNQPWLNTPNIINVVTPVIVAIILFIIESVLHKKA